MPRRFSNRYNRAAAQTAFVSAAAACLAFILYTSCDLMMPPTGLPEDGPNLRSTPRGTIEYLFRAYENQRIDLFMELLPRDGSYRFFISPDYSDVYAATNSTDARSASIEDGEYHYITPGNYRYWNQNSEIIKHRRLFDMADEITFTHPPDVYINEHDFRYTIDDNGDTLRVELRIISVELCVGVRDTLYCTPNRQTQVFLLEREADGRTGNKLWVIKDWFDLDT